MAWGSFRAKNGAKLDRASSSQAFELEIFVALKATNRYFHGVEVGEGLGFRACSIGGGAWFVVCEVQGLGCGVQGLGFEVLASVDM